MMTQTNNPAGRFPPPNIPGASYFRYTFGNDGAIMLKTIAGRAPSHMVRSGATHAEIMKSSQEGYHGVAACLSDGKIECWEYEAVPSPSDGVSPSAKPGTISPEVRQSAAPMVAITDSWRNHRVTTFAGSRDTRIHDGTDYATITLGDLFEGAGQPAECVKDGAPAFVPSSYCKFDARKHEVQRESGLFASINGDVDKGNVPLETLKRLAFEFFGSDMAMLFYSSSSATAETKKWRIVAPLAEPIQYAAWNELSQAFYSFMEAGGVMMDWALCRAGQPVYLPNVRSDMRDANGQPEFYVHHMQYGRGSHVGDQVAVLWIARLREQRQAEETKKAKASVEGRQAMISKKAKFGASDSVIDAYNANYSIDSLLSANGYDRSPSNDADWHSPYQTGSTFATRVYDGYWVSLSESDKSARLGLVTKNGFSTGDAFDLFCHFDHGGKHKEAIKGAARLMGMDRLQLVPVDLSGILSQAPPAAERFASAPKSAVPWIEEKSPSTSEDEREDAFPGHLLNPPGILRESMDWILSCAQKPQPILALAASLSIVATVLAQKVKSESGARTNLYLVSVADTSAGKDHGRKCLKSAFQAAGLANMLGGEEIASGPGLLAGVRRCPASVFQLDEFGLMLKSINGKGAGAHLQQIITNLMKLFTSAGSIYTGTEYADQTNRPRVDIEYPCVNVHATTTPDPLFDSFGSGDVASGSLNRLLILFTPNSKFPFKITDEQPPPDKLVNWMKAARALRQGQLVGLMPGNPVKILMTDGAKNLFKALYEFEQEQVHIKRESGLHHLWGRCVEHASKVALVVACAKHADAQQFLTLIEQGQVMVDEVSAKWAIDFVKHVMGRMEREVATRVADSEFGQLVQAAQRFILKAGARGLTERELARAFRKFAGLMPVQRDAVLETIRRNEAAAQVEFEPESGRGRGRHAWVACEFFDSLADASDTDVSAGINVNKDVDVNADVCASELLKQHQRQQTSTSIVDA